MKIFRTIIITLIVFLLAILALHITLPTSEVTVQPPTAVGATISLVNALPTVKAEPAPADESQTNVVEETEEPKPQEDKDVEQPLSMEEQSQETISEVGEETLSSPASEATTILDPSPLPSLIDGYVEESSVEKGPLFDRALLASRITYPPLARRQGIEGLVVLRLFIAETGKVERIVVEEDPGYGLAEAAVKAFTGLQGTPAIMGGKAVPVTLRYPVRFNLR